MNHVDHAERNRLLELYRKFDFDLGRWKEILRTGDVSLSERPGSAGQMPLPPGTREIAWNDPEYPPALDHWQDSRFPVLYAQGAPIPPHSSLVAIVGTRNPTLFGRRHAEWFTRSVAAAGLGVVSGLARGIDGLAHLHGLSTYTVAVLGSAIDRIYPPEHAELACMILERGGTILSPFPPGHETRPSNFVRRNRIIAGLAAGTIVIEGDEKSGANTTGQFALDLERPCFTLLRDFDTPSGRGSMKLLDAGAHWAASPEHALAGIARPFGGKMQTLKEASSLRMPCEFQLDEWIGRYENIGEALQELERQILLGNVEPLGHGRYKNGAERKPLRESPALSRQK